MVPLLLAFGCTGYKDEQISWKANIVQFYFNKNAARIVLELDDQKWKRQGFLPDSPKVYSDNPYKYVVIPALKPKTVDAFEQHIKPRLKILTQMLIMVESWDWTQTKHDSRARWDRVLFIFQHPPDPGKHTLAGVPDTKLPFGTVKFLKDENGLPELNPENKIKLPETPFTFSRHERTIVHKEHLPN